MKKLTVDQKRRNLLKERYEAGKIAALNNESAIPLKNSNGNYCLQGAMMFDEEIEKRNDGNDGLLDIYEEKFSVHGDYPRVYQQHDKCVMSFVDKTPLINRIKKIIATGVVCD
jgi:hypothetical protein